MKPIQTFSCKSCGHPLGNHDHRRFIAGGSVFTQPTPITCAKCGCHTNWSPTPATYFDKIKEKVGNGK